MTWQQLLYVELLPRARPRAVSCDLLAQAVGCPLRPSRRWVRHQGMEGGRVEGREASRASHCGGAGNAWGALPRAMCRQPASPSTLTACISYP